MREQLCKNNELMEAIKAASPEKTALLNSFIMKFAHENVIFPDALVIDLIQKILNGNLTKIEEIGLELIINPNQFASEQATSCYQNLNQRLYSARTDEDEDDADTLTEMEIMLKEANFLSQQSSTLFSNRTSKIVEKKSFAPIYTIWIGEPIKDPTSEKFLHDVLGPISFAKASNNNLPVTFVCSDEHVSWYENLFCKLDLSQKVHCVGMSSLFQTMHDTAASATKDGSDDKDISILNRARALFSEKQQLETVRDKVSCKELIAWCILSYLGGVVIDTGVMNTTANQFPASTDFRFPILIHHDRKMKSDVYVLQSPQNNPVVQEALQVFVGQLEILRFLSASFKNNPDLCEALNGKLEQYESFMKNNKSLDIGHKQGEPPLSLLAALESSLVMHSLHAGLYATMEQVDTLPVQPFNTKSTFTKYMSVVEVVPSAKVIKIFGNSHYELSSPESRSLNSVSQTIQKLFSPTQGNLREWGLNGFASMYDLHLSECIGYSTPSQNLGAMLKDVQERVTSICLDNSPNTKLSS